MEEIKEYDLTERWECKRVSVYNLKENIDRLKRKVKADLYSSDEKTRLTALIVRIMLFTSERVGNEESAKNGHFGVTQFRKKHISVIDNTVYLDYVGKSGVDHVKQFTDEASAMILNDLLKRNKGFVFVTKDSFQIKPDKVNRYLRRFNAKSKDIRGFNANRLMVQELNRIGKVKDAKQRAKIFNEALRKIAKKIGHGAPTLRKKYLLPEIEEYFYKHGSIGKVKI